MAMKLREMFNHIRESEIIKLTYQGSLIGLRISVFDPDAQGFKVYDFDKKYVQDKKIQSFLSNNMNNFRAQELMPHNNSFMTSDEISGAVQVLELKSAEETDKILTKVKAVYEYNATHAKG